MRGRWLKKVGKFADKVMDKVSDEVKDKVQDRMEQVNLGDVAKNVSAKGTECATLCRETIEICEDTAQKRQDMVHFGRDIQSTLASFQTGDNDASILGTIQELTAGDKVQAAMELASGLDVAAKSCVEKSIKIVDLMEEGMDSLPEYVQTAIEYQAGHQEGNDDDDDDLECGDMLKDLDRDLMDIQTCMDAIQHLNLTTALSVGLQAFTNLADKAQRSQSMFDSVRTFAVDVQEIAQAFEHMNPMAVTSKSKDMLRVIRLSESMRLVAQGAGKLMDMMIALFKATADRISVLWSALAHAKECMSDCMEHVNQAKQLCLDAKDKSTNLITKSVSVKDQLEEVGQINMQSIQAVRSLSQDGEIKEAIDLATNMDDLVVECSTKVIAMVSIVQEGFASLPEILTADICVSESGTGRDEGDPEPANVEDDIVELEESKLAIEEADMITAARAGVKGFAGVSDKATICQDMVDIVEQFAGNCSGTIESFLSAWDLESAGKKITEMCQLVNLGEMMKQFADQIKRLLVAIIALMKAAAEKFSQGFPALSENMGETFDAAKHGMEDTFEDARDRVENKVDDLKDQMKDKLQFWK